MNKLKISFIIACVFLYVMIPSRSVTLLPECIMKDSISVVQNLNPVKIKGYKVYNAGILDLRDGYLFVTRKSGESFIDSIWNRFFLKNNVKGLLIGELDNDYIERSGPQTVYRTDEFADGYPVQYIDPRLFRHKGDVYMVYCRQVNRKKNKRLSTASLQLAKLKKVDGKWEVTKDVPLVFDGGEEFYVKGLVNSNFEKNWMPFSDNGDIYFVYLMSPEHIILKLDLDTGKTTLSARTSNDFPKDSYQLRGSSPVVFDEELGEFLTLYHFVVPTVRNTGKKAHAYFMGGYTFSKDYPYKILRKTDGALVGDGLYDNYRKFIFPTSLIRDGEDYLVFYGDDDETNKVARIPRKELIASLRKL